MRKAHHPFNNKNISVPEFIKEFGHTNLTGPSRAKCPICSQPMSIVGASSPGSIGHFAHMPRSGFCPTKSKAASQYKNLLPQNPDPEAARQMKIFFAQNWKKHFKKLDSIVKQLRYQEFIEIIKLAGEARIWEYARLEEFQIPYVFATLTDFAPNNAATYGRRYHIRCWFDASVSRYDDLWIHRDTPLKFFRAEFEISSRKKTPNIDDLLGVYEENINAEFLKNEVQLPNFVENKIAEFISKNFIHIV